MTISVQALTPQVGAIVAGLLLVSAQQIWVAVPTVGAGDVRLEALSASHYEAPTPTAVISSGPDHIVKWMDEKFADWLTLQYFIVQWHKERGHSSLTRKIVLCDSYQRIIAMGPNVVPLILRQLKSEGGKPDHWFWALRALTGQDPVPQELRGNRKQMARAWLEWGELNNGLRAATVERLA